MIKKILYLIVGIIALFCAAQGYFYWRATTSPGWIYAQRALKCKGPNYDLRYCVDLPKESRKDFSNTTWKPMPCINTASSFYNDKYRAGNCNKFMNNPARWGFYEVSEEEARPGDMMLFIRKKDGARHAGVYTMDSLLGPLCGNTIIGGVFMQILPIKPLLAIHLIGFYKVKYYRFEG